jgi:ribonuclease E
MLDLLLLLLSLCRPARLLSWALCLAGVVALWLAMEKATLRDYIKARARYNSYYEQVQHLQRQQQQYKTELTEIKAGGFHLEKTIREQCPLIRPGEKVVYIETPDDRKAAAAREQSKALEPRVGLGNAPTPAMPPSGAAPDGDAETAKPAARAKAAEAEETPALPRRARAAAATADPDDAPAEQAGAAPSGRSTKKAGARVGQITVRSSGKKAATRTAAKSATKKKSSRAKAKSTAAAQTAATPRLTEF